LAPTESGADKNKAPFSGRFYRVYKGLSKQVLLFRVPVLVLAAGTLLLGGFVSTKLVREFFGPSERNQFLIYLDLPAGSRIETTDVKPFDKPRWESNDSAVFDYVDVNGLRWFSK